LFFIILAEDNFANALILYTRARGVAMADLADDLEKLLADVRKTISDNRQFLEKLVDEAVEDDSEDETEPLTVEEDFEEL
jgi:hypothetical protein